MADETPTPQPTPAAPTPPSTPPSVPATQPTTPAATLPTWTTVALALTLVGNLVLVAALLIGGIFAYEHFHPAPVVPHPPPAPTVVELPVSLKVGGKSTTATLSLTLPPSVAPSPSPVPPAPTPTPQPTPVVTVLQPGFKAVAVFDGSNGIPPLLVGSAISSTVGDLGGSWYQVDSGIPTAIVPNAAVSAAKASGLPALVLLNPDGSIFGSARPLPDDAASLTKVIKSAMGKN